MAIALKSQRIGKITTQQVRTNQVNKAGKVFFIEIRATIYLLESMTRIPIQILYVHGHLEITRYDTTF